MTAAPISKSSTIRIFLGGDLRELSLGEKKRSGARNQEIAVQDGLPTYRSTIRRSFESCIVKAIRLPPEYRAKNAQILGRAPRTLLHAKERSSDNPLLM